MWFLDCNVHHYDATKGERFQTYVRPASIHFLDLQYPLRRNGNVSLFDTRFPVVADRYVAQNRVRLVYRAYLPHVRGRDAEPCSYRNGIGTSNDHTSIVEGNEERVARELPF